MRFVQFITFKIFILKKLIETKNWIKPRLLNVSLDFEIGKYSLYYLLLKNEVRMEMRMWLLRFTQFITYSIYL